MGSVWEAGKKDPEYRKALEGLEQEAALARLGLDGSNAEEVVVLPREEQRPDRMVRKEKILGIQDGLLYRKGVLWIPEDEGLKKKHQEKKILCWERVHASSTSNARNDTSHLRTWGFLPFHVAM
jgi:hypothetical protein